MEWKLLYAHEEECRGFSPLTIAQLEQSGFDQIPATVPGNFELDLIRAGREEDLYNSVNPLRAQNWEDCHVWYYTVFNAQADQYLHFAGIDTVADIIMNGGIEKHVENMYLAYDVFTPLKQTSNELIIHIYPAVLAARKYELPASCTAQKYSMESLGIRKAPHMYGWDIMPRIVSCGIWKPVTLETRKKDAIKEFFAFVVKENVEEGWASLRFFAGLELSGTNAREYSMTVDGVCGESTFSAVSTLWHNYLSSGVTIQNCCFWWPKNYGDPHLYDVTVRLLHKGELVDQYSFRLGVRTVELERTDVIDQNGNGEFVFRVNGKKIFWLGTNWVPLDAFHSRDEERLEKACELLLESGCNGIRCWGGNVYGSDSLYAFCDEHGIMVWQDFAMACGVYPMTDDFTARLTEEVTAVVKQLRQHASLLLWSGDNECDESYSYWGSKLRDPNNYRITRRVIPDILEVQDFTRPYLPSSPFLSGEVVRTGLRPPEDHLWGPRDYFKGHFYKDNDTRFASETGYHGCPSPESLKQFIAPGKLWPLFNPDGTPNSDYLIHAAAMEEDPRGPFAYRIRLMANQVKTLFTKEPEDLDTFAKMSQISQAEAKKFFIERFRYAKWHRTGIIWWNLLDGWPQISDAVVDWYGVKKLAFSYIQRSQQPLCLLCGEPDEAGRVTLYGVLDGQTDAEISYRVTDVLANNVILSGTTVIPADSSLALERFVPAEKTFYLISWVKDGKEYRNHFFSDLIQIDYDRYMEAIRACGFDEFEGF